MNLEAELECRKSRGHMPITVLHMAARLKALGYRMDRTMDCKSLSRIMTGDRAGESYPVITTGVREIDSGKSFAHFEARRDANFKELQSLRYEQSCFAIVNGHILEI